MRMFKNKQLSSFSSVICTKSEFAGNVQHDLTRNIDIFSWSKRQSMKTCLRCNSYFLMERKQGSQLNGNNYLVSTADKMTKLMYRWGTDGRSLRQHSSTIFYPQKRYFSLTIYNKISDGKSLFFYHCDSGNLEAALIMFETLKKENPFELNIDEYHKLIYLMCCHRKYLDCLSYIQSMTTYQITPTIKTFNIILSHVLKEIVESKKNNEKLPMDFDLNKNPTVAAILNERDKFQHLKGLMDICTYNSFLNSYAKLQLWDKCFEIKDEIINKNIGLDSITINIFIWIYCHLGHYLDALQLLKEMISHYELEPDAYTWSNIVGGLKKNGDIAKILQFIECLPESMNWNIHTNTLELLLKELEILNEMKICEVVAKFAIAKKLDLSESLKMRILCRIGEDINVKDFISQNSHVTSNTYCSIIRNLCKKGRISEALEIIDNIGKSRFYADPVIYNPLISYYCQMDNIDEAMNILKLMKENKVPPNTATFNTIINAYCERKDMENAMRLTNKLPQYSLTPNIITYNTLIKGYTLCSNMEKANQLFNLMIKNRTGVNQITIVTLVKGYTRCGQFDEAVNLEKKMINLGIKTNKFVVDVFKSAKREKRRSQYLKHNYNSDTNNTHHHQKEITRRNY